MAKIVVFDSGFGSLSIIKELQKKTKSEIIYFADQKNFPYGAKSIANLRKLIQKSIHTLREEFEPDLIIVGSNTPSLLLRDLIQNQPMVTGVLPPLQKASKVTNSKSIAVLATKSVVASKALTNFIKQNISKKNKVVKINASPLVSLVESGKFIYDKERCRKKITSILTGVFQKNKVEVATLSSTHLPFLLPILHEVFPHVIFVDPANKIATKVANLIGKKRSKRNTLRIFTSGNVRKFQKNLRKIGIKNKVSSFSV